MNSNNAYKFYVCLHKKHHPDRNIPPVLMALVRYIPVLVEHQFLILLPALYYQQVAFKTLKRKQPGRSHQSQAMIVNSSGRDCRYKKCLGFNMPRKRPISYPTKYRCEECTQEKGIDFWLCNTSTKVDGVQTILDCHAKYHVERKLFVTTTSTTSRESSVISDLTEE
jgi:hypothetical protein